MNNHIENQHECFVGNYNRAKEIVSELFVETNEIDRERREVYAKYATTGYLGRVSYNLRKIVENKNQQLTVEERCKLEDDLYEEQFQLLKQRVVNVEGFPIDEIFDPHKLRQIRDKLGLEQRIILSENEYEMSGRMNSLRGFEVELGKPPIDRELDSYLKSFDRVMQATGSMVCNDSFREVAFPPSTMNQQLAGLAEMINLGFILDGQEVGIQINTSGIVNAEKYMKQFLLIHLALSAAGVFQMPDPDIELCDSVNKTLFKDDPGIYRKNESQVLLFDGLPIRFKGKGIVEFRLLQKDWSSFEKFKNGALLFENLIKALESYSKLNENPDNVEEEDRRLCKKWEEFEAGFSDLIECNLISREGYKVNLSVDKYLEAMSNFIHYTHLNIISMEDDSITPEEVEESKMNFLRSIGVSREVSKEEFDYIFEVYRNAYSPEYGRPNEANYYYEIERLVLGSALKNSDLRRSLKGLLYKVK